jgi:hypothetical protein
LTPVTQQWLEAKGFTRDELTRLLEKHHITGEAHDPDLTVTLCLNCHREITEELACEGVNMRPEKDIHKLTALRLRASAQLFESLAKSNREWATSLENQNEP